MRVILAVLAALAVLAEAPSAWAQPAAPTPAAQPGPPGIRLTPHEECIALAAVSEHRAAAQVRSLAERLTASEKKVAELTAELTAARGTSAPGGAK